ncbi:MAG: glycosyltransferase [Duncaniella sp.]|nr:glycosyltransferase [Duncaniella sp.]
MCSETAPRLSVLIPCYGTASLVGRCLESLVPLAGQGVEIVMIDDCSPDGVSDAIARALSHEAAPLAPYTRVMKNPRNIGLAATRGRLVDEARGRYIAIADSDDFVDARAMLDALDVAETSGTDIVAAPFFTVTGDRVTRNNIPGEYDLNRLPVHVRAFSLCNKLIRCSFFADNGLRWFEGLNRWEDLGMTSRIYALDPKIVTVDYGWYYYSVEPSRVTLSSYSREATVADRAAIVRHVEAWMAERGLAGKYKEFLTALKFYAKAGYLRRPVDIKAWRALFPEAKATFTSPRALPLIYRVAFGVLGCRF